MSERTTDEKGTEYADDVDVSAGTGDDVFVKADDTVLLLSGKQARELGDDLDEVTGKHEETDP